MDSWLDFMLLRELGEAWSRSKTCESSICPAGNVTPQPYSSQNSTIIEHRPWKWIPSVFLKKLNRNKESCQLSGCLPLGPLLKWLLKSLLRTVLAFPTLSTWPQRSVSVSQYCSNNNNNSPLSNHLGTIHERSL